MNLTPEQQRVAAALYRIGKRRGESPIEIRAAIATGLVESNLHNLNYGDADSQGWRQERASLYPNPTNLKASINRFYDETSAALARNPYGRAGNLAADVQRPAAQYRGRYQERMGDAREILRQLRGSGGGGSSHAPGGSPTVVPGRPPQAAGLGGLAVSPPDLSALSQLMAQPQQAPAPTPIQAPEFSATRYLPSNGMPVQSRQPVPQDNPVASALAAIGQVQGGLSPMASAASAGTPTKVIPGGPTNGPRGRTLVIGDSLEVGTFPLLKKMLGGKVQGVFVGGKPSSWGIDQLRQQFRAGKFQNVVFDMGTNDATASELRQSLRQLTKIAGGAKVYVSTVNSPFDEGAKNRLLRTYARKHPNVELIRWHGEHGPLADGIHGDYGHRANVIAGALGYDPRATQPAPPGGGKVKVLPGADRSGVPTAPVVKNFLSSVSAFLGRPVTISTGSHHDQYVDGRPGVVSDHWTGHGADLGSVSNGFSVGGVGGDRLAAAAIRAATGWSQKRAMAVAKAGGIHNFTPTSGPWKGQRIQVIWKAPDGSHRDHVHVGLIGVN